MIKIIWDEIKKIKSGEKELREFGLTIGIVFAILCVLTLWRGKAVCPYFLALAVLFAGFGIILPQALKPLQKIWMAFSVIVGFVASRVIVFVLFYAVLTPIGFIIRVTGRDILDERIDKTKASYWHKRPEEAKPKEYYENQY